MDNTFAARIQRKRKPKELSVEDGKGRVVASYYNSEDLAKLTKAAKTLGLAAGGLQHEAAMDQVEKILHVAGLAAEDAQKDKVEGSADALTEIAKLVEPDKWKPGTKPGRLPDPFFAFGHPEEEEEEKSDEKAS